MKNGFRNWSDVRIFLAVIREGSTLAASHKLGIAQPTVARRIEALEHDLGLTLFERDTRGFKPTDDARDLLPLAQAIEAASSDFAEKAQGLAAPRPIRITATTANFSARVTAIFSEYTAICPETAFEFLPGLAPLNLLAGEADIALRLTSIEPDKELICRHISTAKFALYGGKKYAEQFGLPKSADALAGHKFLTFRRKDVPQRFHEWMLRHNVTPDQIVVPYTEIDLMHAAIKAGLGLGIMNMKLAESYDGFIQCFDAIEELTVPHVMLISPVAYRRPEVKAFTKFFAPRYAAVFK